MIELPGAVLLSDIDNGRAVNLGMRLMSDVCFFKRGCDVANSKPLFKWLSENKFSRSGNTELEIKPCWIWPFVFNGDEEHWYLA